MAPGTTFKVIYKDSAHLINTVKELVELIDVLLCTLDVTHVYGNIPHSEGISAINEMWATHGQLLGLHHSSYLVEVLKVVLTNNYLSSMEHTTIRYQAEPWALS